MHLAYKAYGTGHPLIILHGLLGSGSNWHTLSSKVFSEHFHVVVPDLRNHGRSPHSDTFDYASMVEDVIEWMDRHDLATAYLLGHSMGGKTAMHAALTYPERIDRLIVVDMAPGASAARHEAIFAALRRLDLSAYRTRQEIDAALAEGIPNMGERQFLLKNLSYDREAGVYRWQMNLEGIYRNYDALNEAIEPGRTFDGPTLFIRGGASDYVQDEDVPLIHALFPQARLVTVEGAGHWVHADQPDALARVVIDFLHA